MNHADARVPPHFLVVVPGMMGSKLRDRRTGKLVWLDFDDFPLNPLEWDDWIENLLGQMAYPNDDLEPAGIMDRVVFVAPWARQEQYSRLLNALEGMGYCFDPSTPEAERNAYTFAYDWRQDIRITGRLLAEAIERWYVLHDGAPAWVIGHSMGGIAARWCIENEGGSAFISRLFLMASPWNGAPKALSSIFTGLDMFMRARFDLHRVREVSRRTIRSFPSAYQILPHEGYYLRDARGSQFDPCTADNWLDTDAERALLADAQRFNQELGKNLSVETLSFFGRKRPTVREGVAVLAESGLWDAIAWETGPAGDGTVPEASAVHAGASQNLPYVASHGSIYAHPAVLEVLQWELRDRFLAGEGAEAPIARNTLSVTAEKDQVPPGAPIQLSAAIEGEVSTEARARLDVHPGFEALPADEQERDGRIHVQLAWESGLPGNPPLREPPDVVSGVLERGPAPGEYTGQLQAPYAEGYYRLLSEVWLDGTRLVDTDLLCVDDGHPGWSVDPVTGKVVARPEA